MSTSYDAVVVGAGPNGLVAANLLTDAGWSVLVLEAQDTPGGAVRSDREMSPAYVSDTFSAFYPFAAASPVVRSLRLEEHGLEWRHAPAVLGHPYPDGRWALLHRDRQETARLADAEHPGDGEAWLEMVAQWDRLGDSLLGALLSPMPPVRHALGVLARLPRAGGLGMVQQLLTPAMDLGHAELGGDALRILMAGNAGHADIPLEASGSGLLALIMTMLGQQVGFPVPRGGAVGLTDALVTRLRSRGGGLRCDAEVADVLVRDGRATGVRLRDGERIGARHAVVADVTVPVLFRTLLDPSDVPTRVARHLDRWQPDPATVKVDWALDGKVPWASAPAHAPGTVHVADSREDMASAWAKVAMGVVPSKPFLLMGQMTTADPDRSPPGTESAWGYTHVPQRMVQDEGGEGGEVSGAWGHDDTERFADRMQARIERLAPGFGSRVVARRVLGPHELQARNANLVGGAVGGGTQQLHQQLVFRPVPGMWGRAETGVGGLYLASASAHPGGGVHGGPGGNAARAALAHRRLRLGRR